MNSVLKLIAENWFLTEPAYFALYCRQQLQENVNMECAVRCGQGKLEYNPLILKHKNYAETEQLLRIEMIRLYLKHPYERRPEGCCGEAIATGSDITIADGYCTLRKEKLPLQTPDHYHLPLGQYYEWYAKQLQQQKDSDNNEQQQNNAAQQQSDKSQLWSDDSLKREEIDQLIERTTDWGTMPVDVVERIKASTGTKLRNMHVWQGFHGAILNSHRRLTRMRPNRRTSFLQMGSTRQFDTHLLVAIDVSGSVTDEVLTNFFGTVNKLFRYGQVQIDVCQFDIQVNEIVPIQRAQREIKVKGRGGTSFQCIIDRVTESKTDYDGLIILTDGQAPPPVLPKNFHTPILWACHNRQSYDQNKAWMRESGRCCHL